MKNDFTLISAKKSTWFGGREGVKGAIYNIVLKNNQSKPYVFTKFKYGKNSVPFIIKSTGSNIYISANINMNSPLPEIDMQTGKRVDQIAEENDVSEIVLEYQISSSKENRSLKITSISEVENSSSKDALPN
ncbi:hypothetical protein [Halpernia frigidisoli]|nr:hypothetical protein [Halpernia frigidisoli]